MASYRVIVHLGYVEEEVEATDPGAALELAQQQLLGRAARIVLAGRFQVEQIAGDEAAA